MNDKTNIVPAVDRLPVDHQVAQTPYTALLDKAISGNADMEKLQALMDMQDKWEKNEARKAFVRALSAFRAEPIIVEKTKRVNFTTPRGTTDYKHADLADVVNAAQSAMSKHGLAHRWDTVQKDGNITVTCILSHELGHEERTSLTAEADQSGNKNPIQAIGSTITYLERYTFMSATGLAAAGMDDDGAGATVDYERISADQVAELDKLIEEANADRAKFLEWCNVDELEDLGAAYFVTCRNNLLRKKNASKVDQEIPQ